MCERQISPQLYDNIIAACVQAGFSPKIAHESNSFQNQVGIVACGLAITLIPQYIEYLHFPGVVYRPLTDILPLTDTAIVWNPKSSSKLTQDFIKAAKQTFPQ